MFNDYSKIIVCPDCKGNVENLIINEKQLGLLCSKCKLIYPIMDDIPILLGKKARNYILEHDLIRHIQREALHHSIDWMEEYINNTLNLIHKEIKCWEWEDEKFWSQEYEQEKNASIPKNWNDRIWQREFLVNNLISNIELTGKTILDVGCGEGQNFIKLLSKFCDDNTKYIAADISLEGLKLNRSRNNHSNSLYILCSADSLPFTIHSIDVLCYFGILHHTERKADIISENAELLKKGGHVLIHEALEVQTSQRQNYKPKSNESAHEERIRKNDILHQIKNDNFQIIAKREIITSFYIKTMGFYSSFLIMHKNLFIGVMFLDILFMKLFGCMKSSFKGRELMMLLKKK